MDFLTLLKTRPEVKDDKIDNKKDEIKYQGDSTFNLEQVQFKKGENVRIIYLEDSGLNYYKGYNGVIKDSLISNNHCMVILDAVNSTSPIKFPKSHIIKWCPYSNIEL